jgi:7-keto-8-aminopelargonate synthetase-like enzyme
MLENNAVQNNHIAISEVNAHKAFLRVCMREKVNEADTERMILLDFENLSNSAWKLVV